MEVQLLSWTPEPEALAAAAARLCYRDISARQVLDEITDAEIEHLLDLIISSGHLSVVEHVTFTFAIDGISRVISHQLVRHRVGTAISQQSQRYTKVSNAAIVLPPSIARNAEARGAYEKVADEAARLYERMIELDIPAEDARYVLPQAVETRMVFTVNLRELRQIYMYDACLRSQWEMRHLVNALKREVRSVSPRLARELKIKCFLAGYCDEAEMCSQLDGLMPRRRDVLARSAQRNKINYDDLEQLVEP